MPQEGDLPPEKMTFRGLELQSVLPESFEHCPQPGQVFLLSLGEDNDIIQIDKGICEVEFPQTVLHQPLEDSWNITQSIWHLEEFEDSHTSDSEGGLLSGLFSHLDLPEPGFQIHCRKELGSDHGFHSLLHAWKWVGILLGPSIEPLEVDAEPESPIFLLDQDHRITPRRL